MPWVSISVYNPEIEVEYNHKDSYVHIRDKKTQQTFMGMKVAEAKKFAEQLLLAVKQEEKLQAALTKLEENTSV
jgi:hypothetical protein